MTVFNIDLEDGEAPVSFVLKPYDAERFMAFMDECHELRKEACRLKSVNDESKTYAYSQDFPPEQHLNYLD